MENSAGMRRTIMVVDDDHGIVHTLQEDLEQEGYHVAAAYDGQMALALSRARKLDLIILDVDMPITNGLVTFNALRQFPATQRTPVIFLSGVVSARVYPTVEAHPRVAHLKKPIDLDELNSLVRHFLEKYPVD